MSDHHAMLADVTDHLDTLRSAEIDALGYEDAARLYAALRSVRRQVQDLEDAVMLRVARLAPKDPVTLYTVSARGSPAVQPACKIDSPLIVNH